MKTINVKITVIIITLVLLNILTYSYFKTKNNNLSTENYNLTVQNDTIKKNYNRLTKQFEFSKGTYTVNTAKDLKQFNKDLYNQTKQTKNTAVAIQVTANINLPTQSNLNTLSDSNRTYINTHFKFQYSDSSVNQTISGSNRIDLINKEVLTSIDTNKIQVKLSYNVVNQSDKYIITALSRSKYVNFSDLNSVLIINKLPVKQQNRWKFGLFMGYGINSNVKLTDFRVGWSCGVGLNYRLF